MPFDAILIGRSVFAAVNRLLAYSNKIFDDGNEKAQIEKILNGINKGIWEGFVLTAIPMTFAADEIPVAAIPRTNLLEPKSIRVTQRRYQGSSYRFRHSGFSISSGRGASTSETHESLRKIDQGLFVLTTQRIIFLGELKTLTFDLEKVLALEPYADGIGLHLNGKERVEVFQISSEVTLKRVEDQREIAVPFAGSILGRLVSMTMALKRVENELRPPRSAA
jgi:hypothetical protein